ncbi:MAG: DUF3794 domain-containing protein [Clostridia bacterium]|nr:DUF3794 domain-containing protein [Clostridia bacterium]
MENTIINKIAYTKNLSRQNFNILVNTPVDNNANIKTIINVNAYIYDKKIETANNKAIVSGKIGVKVLYIDTDNIFSTLTDSQSFSETIADTSITSDSYINLVNENLVCEVLSFDGVLKLNCSYSFNPVLYINIPMTELDCNCEGLMTKKCSTQINSIANIIDTSFEYSCTLETKYNISKILSYRSYFILTESIACENSIIVSGNIHSHLLFEVEEEGKPVLKTLTETNLVKTDIPTQNLTSEQILDLIYNIDQSKNEISSEIEDENSIITINHTIKVTGLSIQPTTLELVDDMYSCNNEINLNFAEREFNNNILLDTVENYISGEISINESELAIDSVVCNSNINSEIVNTYIKDGSVFIEGIISSQLVYVDENREYRLKNIEIPFILDTKSNKDVLETNKAELLVKECKTKVKRGTIVEFEYNVIINITHYSSSKLKFIDNYTLGKSLDFSKYDYQIYLSKPNETIWELSKRICITPEDLCLYNKDLPSIMTGNEKIIVKR